MNNYLLKGSPGTGKTFLARAAAYYICHKKLNIADIFLQDVHADLDEIEKFINGEFCEFIQVHPAMSYEDIVYGIDIRATGTMTVAYAEKRIKTICDNAKGKSDLYAIVFDDISRTDASALLGNLLYAIEYRDQDIELIDGSRMSVPQNVVIIFTECDGFTSQKLDYAVRRRMDFVKELKADRKILETYYSKCLDVKALKIILDTFDSVENYIQLNILPEYKDRINLFVPGHGLYIVPRIGSRYVVLDRVKQRILFQVLPHLEILYSQGIIGGNLDDLFETIKSFINTGVAGLNTISSVKKIMVNSGVTIMPYTLSDTKDYLENTIVPNHSTDHKGVLESVIDAVILNGVFPHDISVPTLLMNIDIAAIPSKSVPVVYASYLINKDKVADFYYETPRAGRRVPHAYYSTNPGKVGRWAAARDMAGYEFTYNDGTPSETFLPLNGLRAHKFTVETVYSDNNTAEVYGSAYRLIYYYLSFYEMNIDLIKGTDSDYADLYDLIHLEIKYLKAVNKELGRRPGEKTKIDFFGTKLIHLRTLFTARGDDVIVDGLKFEDLLTGKTVFSIDAYEDMYIYTATTAKPIMIRGVVKMTDLKDYQKIMENIGVRQMIFQGPPGTSKTFESKKFVLKQLNPTSTVFSKQFISQADISTALEHFKLSEIDYANPSSSSKLTTGGWDLVQFHPSYGYEDFIRGIEVKASSGMPSYHTVNRILGKIAEFAKLAEQANSATPPKFYLIVDEINRANLATVFGELIYGLEYRDSKVSTPYEVDDKAGSGKTKDIVLGKNLFIIGTMNTADKSIDSIDYAIRRRFIFVDSPADRKVVLSCYHNITGKTDESSIEVLLFDSVQAVFDNANYFNDEYQKSDVRLGHTYFLRKDASTYLDDIVEHFVFQIIPILREYVKDGILDSIEDLLNKEHTVAEIKVAGGQEVQVALLSDNVMLFAKCFGDINNAGKVIDNAYIGAFIEKLCSELGY